MPATSKRQQRFFGMVRSGRMPKPRGMTMEQVSEFASGPMRGKPESARTSKDHYRKGVTAK